MGDAKHTPWPMTVKRIYGYSSITIAENDQDTVRLVQYRNEAGGHEGEVAVFMGEHSEGNANLFVASTDLLAVCLWILDPSNHAIREDDPLVQMARAAVAKAKGRD